MSDNRNPEATSGRFTPAKFALSVFLWAGLVMPFMPSIISVIRFGPSCYMYPVAGEDPFECVGAVAAFGPFWALLGFHMAKGDGRAFVLPASIAAGLLAGLTVTLVRAAKRRRIKE